jgi:hypothetical protein
VDGGDSDSNEDGFDTVSDGNVDGLGLLAICDKAFADGGARDSNLSLLTGLKFRVPDATACINCCMKFGCSGSGFGFTNGIGLGGGGLRGAAAAWGGGGGGGASDG